MVKNKKNIFYKPIKLRQSFLFLKSNSLKYFRLMIVIPKHVLNAAISRNNLKRIIRNFILKSSFQKMNLDLILILQKVPSNINDILYIIKNIWIKYF